MQAANDIDPVAIYLAKRAPRKGGITPAQRIAINLLWRRDIKVPVLARIFRVSKNTIYYKSLTGEADSYPNSRYSNDAKDTNEIIDYLGVEAATARFITPDIAQRVNAELERDADRKAKAVRRR